MRSLSRSARIGCEAATRSLRNGALGPCAEGRLDVNIVIALVSRANGEVISANVY
jgi:hypothetical protein